MLFLAIELGGPGEPDNFLAHVTCAVCTHDGVALDTHMFGLVVLVIVNMQDLVTCVRLQHPGKRTFLVVEETRCLEVMGNPVALVPDHRVIGGVVGIAVGPVGGNDRKVLVEQDKRIGMRIDDGLQVQVRLVRFVHGGMSPPENPVSAYLF